MLAKLGGFDIAGLCGVFLGGALEGVPVLADGFISGVAALCAVRLCPAAAKAVFASHCSTEPAAQLVLDALDKKPLITAGLHLGEGTGAVASHPAVGYGAGRLRRLLFLCGGRHRRRTRRGEMLTLVLGGAASGKSAYAESLVLQAPPAALLSGHHAGVGCRVRRPGGKAPQNAGAKAVRNGGVPAAPGPSWLCPRRGTVLLEDLGNLAANELYDPGGAGEHTAEAILPGLESLAAAVR